MKKYKNIKYLFFRSWNVSKSLFFIIAAKSIFTALMPLVNIAGLGIVVNALMTNNPFREVMRLIIIYMSVKLGIAIIGEVLTMLDNIVERKVSNIMQFDYINDCLYINYHYVQDKSILDLKKKSMGAHPAFFLSDVGKFLKYLVQFAGIIYIFSLLSPLFLFVLMFTSALSTILTFSTRKIEFNFKNNRVEEDRKLDYLYTVMSGYKYAKEIRLNNAGSFIENKYQKILKVQTDKLKAFYKKSISIDTLRTIIAIVQTAAMYFYFSYQVFSQQVTIAEYTVLLGTTTLLTSILLGFFDNIARLNQTAKYVDLYREYINMIETRSIITQSNLYDEKDIDFSNATIRFENVSFVYPNTEKIVLKNINIKIKKGDRIGIVGLNGSGKTTFIKLLTRIYDPTEGRITINGIDIKEIPYLQYSKHIGIVLQDFFLFAYSIKENIVFDQVYDKNKLKTSIEKSNLKSKVSSLKNGIDTVIYKELDDDGIEFSGGEEQKLALARAIYKDAELLILDEPTSALDPLAEYDLFSKLNEIAENKTAIFISHRLSSTKFCNRIIVLENGQIVECGSHKELMQENGIYSVLFNSQAKYYEDKGVSLKI